MPTRSAPPPPLDVYLTPCALGPDVLKGRAVVVVDVLRASSTIVTALAHGARAVVPVATTGDAARLAGTIDADLRVLGGERGGLPIAGYDAGNSPLEYTPERVRGRTVILTTTNGTAALVAARDAARVAVGSFVNAAATAAFMRAARADDLPVVVLCAGTDGRVSMEDTLCAGLLLSRVAAPGEVGQLSDSAQIAHALYQGSREALARTLFGAAHTQHLIRLGFADDIAYCARLDAFDALPLLQDGRVALGA